MECKGKILMIKNAYGKSMWTFPGGAVSKNELPEAAAKREIMEEVGIQIFGLKKIGELLNTREYKKDTVHCYIGKVSEDALKIDQNEILEARWFSKDELPIGISSIAKQILSLDL